MKKSCCFRSTKRLSIHFFIFLYFQCLKSTISALESCPAMCRCFLVDSENIEDLHMREGINSSDNITTCQRQWLQTVPRGISPWTTDLHLAYNRLTELNSSSFAQLGQLRSLVLAHNKIRSIGNTTFHHMLNLTYLDLSDNLLRTIPDGMLSPWTSGDPSMNQDATSIACMPPEENYIKLALWGNPWHCTCYLQDLFYTNSCNHVGYSSTCLMFAQISKASPDIGYCSTPVILSNVALNKLMPKENMDDPKKQVVNLCVRRKGEVDVVLLVVIFSWMGVSMAYVIHFVSWNNQEVARHKSYISSLESKNAEAESHEKTTKTMSDSPRKSSSHFPHRKNLQRESCQARQQTLPRVSISSALGEDDALHSAGMSSLASGIESPIWKPRNPKHKRTCWGRATSA